MADGLIAQLLRMNVTSDEEHHGHHADNQRLRGVRFVSPRRSGLGMRTTRAFVKPSESPLARSRGATTSITEGSNTVQTTAYVKDLVAQCLAERGLAGTVEIRAHKPLAVRLDSGERVRFIVDYQGAGTAHLVLDEAELIGGTVGAPLASALADRIERSIDRRRAAA